MPLGESDNTRLTGRFWAAIVLDRSSRELRTCFVKCVDLFRFFLIYQRFTSVHYPFSSFTGVVYAFAVVVECTSVVVAVHIPVVAVPYAAETN